jgi:hypothetical protein
MGVLTFDGVLVASKKVINSTFVTKASSSLSRVAKGMYQTLLSFIETFVTLDIQLTTMFYLMATLCQGGPT